MPSPPGVAIAATAASHPAAAAPDPPGPDTWPNAAGPDAPPVLLVVDDEPQVARLIQAFARPLGFEVVVRHGGREALEGLQSVRADVALVDLQMPEIDGLGLLRAIRAADPHCQTILMTGHATIDSAIEATKLGALDYLSKPFDFERLRMLLAGVKADLERRKALLAAESDMARHLEYCGMIGRSPEMRELFALIQRVAPHIRTALVTGETGVGKELVARALHQRGPRVAGPFVSINCSAIVPTLFESELFGHVRGAFTGATDAKPGLFEVADRGTLFLDEVGDLPAPAQAKLLRALETGEVQRIGGLKARHVDVVVVAATNRHLRSEVAAGRFRRDLFFRLNVVHLAVAPLRDRREDIPYLTAAFLRHFATRFSKPLVGLTPAAERLLLTARWEGNVRELRNVIERACMLSETKLLTERELLSSLSLESSAGLAAASDGGRATGSDPEVPVRGLLSAAERELIERVLAGLGGNKKAAARTLGLSRRALYRRLDRLGIRKPPGVPTAAHQSG